MPTAVVVGISGTRGLPVSSSGLGILPQLVVRAMVRRSAGVLSRGSPRGTRTTTTYQVALGQIRPGEDAPLDALADKGGRRSAQQPLEPHAAQSAWTPPCWRTGPRPAAFAKNATRTVPGDLTAERGDQGPTSVAGIHSAWPPRPTSSSVISPRARASSNTPPADPPPTLMPGIPRGCDSLHPLVRGRASENAANGIGGVTRCQCPGGGGRRAGQLRRRGRQAGGARPR
jgi:hypothetical protein